MYHTRPIAFLTALVLILSLSVPALADGEPAAVSNLDLGVDGLCRLGEWLYYIRYDARLHPVLERCSITDTDALPDQRPHQWYNYDTSPLLTGTHYYHFNASSDVSSVSFRYLPRLIPFQGKLYYMDWDQSLQYLRKDPETGQWVPTDDPEGEGVVPNPNVELWLQLVCFDPETLEEHPVQSFHGARQAICCGVTGDKLFFLILEQDGGYVMYHVNRFGVVSKDGPFSIPVEYTWLYTSRITALPDGLFAIDSDDRDAGGVIQVDAGGEMVRRFPFRYESILRRVGDWLYCSKGSDDPYRRADTFFRLDLSSGLRAENINEQLDELHDLYLYSIVSVDYAPDCLYFLELGSGSIVDIYRVDADTLDTRLLASKRIELPPDIPDEEDADSGEEAEDAPGTWSSWSALLYALDGEHFLVRLTDGTRCHWETVNVPGSP